MYPARSDALEARWRLTQAQLDGLKAAFGTKAGALSPSVRLRRFADQHADGGDDGDMLPVAGVHQGRIGFISLQSDAWYQAELGLASADGGWLMLARSNRLALLPPIRCDFGKEPALADLSAPEQQSARAHCNPAVGTVLSAAGDLFRSQGGVAPAPVNRRGGDAQSAVRAIIEASAAYRNAVDCNAGAGSSAWHDNTFTDRCARSGSDPGSYTGSDPGSDQAVDQALDSALARPIIPSARGAFGARPVAGDDDKARYPTAGSGPIESVRDASDADIWGQLRIGGRAAPGSLLELGGHSYRVGPGGRFAFDLDIADPSLIHALLRLLPALPVTQREEE